MDKFIHRKILLLMFFVWNINLYMCQSIPQCVKVDSCTCACDNGRQIDLKPLGSQSGEPKYKDVKPTQGTNRYKYSYNPCYPFDETASGAYPDECKGVASCRVRPRNYGGGFYGAGTHDSMKCNAIKKADAVSDVSMVQDDYIVTMEYEQKSSWQKYKTHVELVCATAEQFTVFGNDPKDSSTYIYQLQAAEACGVTGGGSGGISAGSVMLIIFCSLLVVYIIGGVLFMKFNKHASGADLCPNVEFWKALPGLIKEGVLFVFSCSCLPSRSYESVL